VSAVLTHRMAAPPGASDGATVLVLLHGRGADESDLLPLGRALGEDVVVVCPRAPFDAAPWGYGPGYAWYRYLGDDRPEPESFTASADALAAFLEALRGELPLRPGKLLLGGFSQGGTTALGTTLARGLRVDGVVVLSGFLPSHPEVDAARAKGLPVFWGHGTHDPAIPHTLGERGRARLLEAGAAVEAHDYRMGHAIHPDEVDDLRRWAGSVGG
jgi:phospholipase/carboxylesterase